MNNILSFDSEIEDHPININITLKKHQLAMLKRCKEIENKDSRFGIMNDKPGTGKTYVILSLIYDTRLLKKTNIIVVPQNIYSQWIISLEKFSNDLSYKKFIDYENIITLYNNPNILSNHNIILTTSSYYHIIATTLSSLNISINRVFFDEIDSISNIISTKINSDFIWFVSASFNTHLLGYYNNELINNNININDIICKCEDDFINSNIILENPNKYYYLCKNIYIDDILGHIISCNDLKSLNAMDYTIDKRRVKNEKEVIQIILINKKNSLYSDKLNIDDEIKNIELYELYNKNLNSNKNAFENIMNDFYNIDEFKNNIIIFLQNFDYHADIYMNINIEDKSRREDIKLLKSSFDNIIDILYNINDISNSFMEFIKNTNVTTHINNIIVNLNKLELLLNSVYEILLKMNNENHLFIDFFRKFIDKLLKIIVDYQNSLISSDKLEIYNKIFNLSTKKIKENELKINLLYERLKKNDCCPICYNLFINNKIYITSTCCNNKICEECIDEWYNIKKCSCIFCNSENVLKDDLLFYEQESVNKVENDNIEIDKNLIEKEDIHFEIKNYSKDIFLKNYIDNIKDNDMNKKIIIFSDYNNAFEYIQEICNNKIEYIDLDKGNIKEMDKAINEYKFGNAKILLCNSKLFGCGMNLENSTDIIFVHKMDKMMENQVIGRAQRMGRKTKLNIIYLEYENEGTYVIDKKEYTYYNNNINNENELEDFYNDKQYYNIIENIKDIDFNNSNDIENLL